MWVCVLNYIPESTVCLTDLPTSFFQRPPRLNILCTRTCSLINPDPLSLSFSGSFQFCMVSVNNQSFMEKANSIWLSLLCPISNYVFTTLSLMSHLQLRLYDSLSYVPSPTMSLRLSLLRPISNYVSTTLSYVPSTNKLSSITLQSYPLHWMCCPY